MLRNFILALVLACLGPFAAAQVSIGPGATNPSTKPSEIMPRGLLKVNPQRIMGKRVGFSTDRLGTTCTMGVDCYVNNSSTVLCTGVPCDSNGTKTPGFSDPDGSGQFRISCAPTHMTFDDPIVYPNKPGMSHLHTFLGQVNTDANTNFDLMASTGNSTCIGGTLNRNAYWVPTLLKHCPFVGLGCNVADDGTPIVPLSGNFYYKGVFTNSSNATDAQKLAIQNMVWPAKTHRMIAGSVANRGHTNGNVSKGGCATGGPFFYPFPTTAEATAAYGPSGCSEFIVLVIFPECNDGHIDSPNHQSHMAYATLNPINGNPECVDPAYPVLFPTVSFNIHYRISNADWDFVRLSSDQPCADEGGPAGNFTCNGKPNNGQPAGHSSHGDWLNGWRDTPVPALGNKILTDVLLDQCIRRPPSVAQGGPVGVDCHDGILGKGSLTGYPNGIAVMQ